MTIDLIIHHGSIYTVEQHNPWITAVAISGRHIEALGSDSDILPLAGDETQVIDLNNRLVLPGLCDAHIHLYDWALTRSEVQIAGSASLDGMKDAIDIWIRENPDSEWITGRGWNEGVWADRRLPTRHDIDQVTGLSKPAIFWRSDMHAAVANSAALMKAGIDAKTPNPSGGLIGREEDGHPSGMLWELAINMVSRWMPVPDDQFLDASFEKAIKALQEMGITSIHDQRMKDQREGPTALAAYQRLERKDCLGLRLNCNIAAHDFPHAVALGLKSGFGNDYLRIGHIKFFADGTMGSQTAWMLMPYRHVQHGGVGFTGIPLTPPSELAAAMADVIEAGCSVSVHAIGDRANRTVLDIFEEMTERYPSPDIPHRIEHVQIIDPQDLARLGQLNITASVQPLHLLDDMDTAIRVLGSQVDRVYNFGRIAAGGARLALGSDAPVADPNPWMGFQAALFRQWPDHMAKGPFFGDERLSLEETIKGYTLGAAEAAGWEDLIGSIRQGKLADMVILDRNLFKLVEHGVKSDELASTDVWMTIFDGRIVHQSEGLSDLDQE